jgi:hypothetical protein
MGSVVIDAGSKVIAQGNEKTKKEADASLKTHLIAHVKCSAQELITFTLYS